MATRNDQFDDTTDIDQDLNRKLRRRVRAWFRDQAKTHPAMSLVRSWKSFLWLRGTTPGRNWKVLLRVRRADQEEWFNDGFTVRSWRESGGTTEVDAKDLTLIFYVLLDGDGNPTRYRLIGMPAVYPLLDRCEEILNRDRTSAFKVVPWSILPPKTIFRDGVFPPPRKCKSRPGECNFDPTLLEGV